jgi:hypothetical protein
MFYWLKRLALNVRGFLAATLAAVLPGASPFVRKLLTAQLTALAIWAHSRLGLEYTSSPELDGMIRGGVEAVIGLLGTFATWRVPNEKPTASDKQNPLIGTATDVPPK